MDRLLCQGLIVRIAIQNLAFEFVFLWRIESARYRSFREDAHHRLNRNTARPAIVLHNQLRRE